MHSITASLQKNIEDDLNLNFSTEGFVTHLTKLLAGFVVLYFGAGGPALGDGSAVFACNEFPPYKMEKSASGLPGFDVEFLKESFRRVGISVDIQYMPWKRALEQARKGQVNGVCSCSRTQEREEYLYFSSPLGKASSGLFSLIENNYSSLNTIEEIGSQSVGVIRGYNLLENLHEAKAKNIYELSNERQGLKMLLKGRLDFYYSYEAPTRYYLAKQKHSDKIFYKETTLKHYYSCFSKASEGSEKLLEKFNAGLALIRNDGTYDKILTKYR
ncbi:MAG: transporter substrate-binding domain-containing protein [Sneathiella sp.]